MSDTGRKDITDKASETIKPDSQKSVVEKAGEAITNAGDQIAATIQPGDSKSTTQKLSDTTSGSGTDAQSAGKTYLEQAQDVANSALKTASDTATNIANSISGTEKK